MTEDTCTHARDTAHAPPSSRVGDKTASDGSQTWRLGFPVHDEAIASALKASHERLERKWRSFIATSSNRDTDAIARRGDFMRAFTRAHGVRESERRAAWFAWSGAEKKQNADGEVTYEEQLRRANAEYGVSGSGSESGSMSESFAQIEMDVPRTFPEHARFAEGGAYKGKLRNVLRATAMCVNTTSGYVQGMNYLAGFLLEVYEGDESSAFWVLRCVLEDMFPGYFAHGLKALRADLDELDFRFAHVSKEAHAKLDSIGLSVKYFTARWLMCALIGCASLPIVLRVWDLIFVDSDRQPRETLIRCSLAILALQAPFIRAAEDMNASVECIREGGSNIDNIEAYLQQVSDMRAMHFPAMPDESTSIAAAAATPSRKRTRYEPPPTPARQAMTPVANTLYASLVSFFSPTPSKMPALTRTTSMKPKRLWSFEDSETTLRKTPPLHGFRHKHDGQGLANENIDARGEEIEMSTPKRKRTDTDATTGYVTSPAFAKSPLQVPARSPLRVR